MIKLAVSDLHLSYGDNAILKGVSMELAQGEVVSLLGPSGSGKTTLLRAVAGLEVPHQGSIRIEDRPVFDGAQHLEVPAEKRNLGLVFQSYALWPHRTVFDNVAYGLKLRGVPAAEQKERVSSALANLGLGHLAERLPHQLSGGQHGRHGVRPTGREPTTRQMLNLWESAHASFEAAGTPLRAEPVAAMYEQGRVTHCGAPGNSFVALEEELLALGVSETEGLLDRADALVWALTALMSGGEGPRIRFLGGERRRSGLSG